MRKQDYPVLVHALLVLTTPFALLSSYSTPFELTHALKLSKATRIFVHARLVSVALPVAKKLGISSRNIHILGGYVSGRKSLNDILEHARASKVPPIQARPAKRDTLAYLVFSSGTSGLPKGILQPDKSNVIPILLFSCHDIPRELHNLSRAGRNRSEDYS